MRGLLIYTNEESMPQSKCNIIDAQTPRCMVYIWHCLPRACSPRMQASVGNTTNTHELWIFFVYILCIFISRVEATSTQSMYISHNKAWPKTVIPSKILSTTKIWSIHNLESSPPAGFVYHLLGIQYGITSSGLPLWRSSRSSFPSAARNFRSCTAINPFLNYKTQLSFT